MEAQTIVLPNALPVENVVPPVAPQQIQIKNILYTEIPFIAQFKTLNEVMSNILKDVTWTMNAPDPKCDPNKPTPFAGLEIATSDPNKTMFVKIKLNLNDNKVLTKYYCKMTKLDIGINLSELFKILKIIGKTDNLSMSIAENDKQRLIITAEGKKKRYWSLKLREPNQKQHQQQVQEYRYIVTMKNEEFHAVCREMSEFAEHLEIKCTANTIMFSCLGDLVNSSYIYKTGIDDVFIESNSKNDTTPYIYQGVFDLKNLKIFSKFSNLCDHVKLFLINGFPITIDYTIFNGGSVVVLLSPTNEQSLKNVSFNYDENDEDSDEDDAVVCRPQIK